DISLLLTTKPPWYVDVARRFLARAEFGRVTPEVGKEIEYCVDALRGTRYQGSRSASTTFETKQGVSLLRIVPIMESPCVRVILSNLPLGGDAFTGAATNQPLLTFGRLRELDRALRKARRAARDAKQMPQILVLPELAVPRRWTRALIDHAVREELSVIAGIEYAPTSRGLVNQALGVFPTGLMTGLTVRWTKRHAARLEETQLLNLGKRFATSKRTERLVVESTSGRIG